jgi:hypothetical protein
MSIIISRDGKHATKVERSVIQQEDYLQRYIHANPDALPLHEIKTDLRLLILAREFPTGSGPIDALGIDGDGEIYVIETKLYKNPDKRLVLAQVLDYGASLWQTYTDPSDFIVRLEQHVQTGLGKGLSASVQEFFGVDDAEFSDIMDSIKRNLSAGTFRFIVLMDRLEERLKHLISFVNANSRFDIIGVELDFYQHEGFEIIIPSLYGAEQKKEIGSTSSAGVRRKWDEVSFFADAESKLDQRDSTALHTLYAWAMANADEVSWGTGGKNGSFNVKFAGVNQRSVLSAFSSGKLTVNFKWLSEPQVSADFADKLGALLIERGFPLPPDFARGYQSLKPVDWAPRVDKLISSLVELGAVRIATSAENTTIVE